MVKNWLEAEVMISVDFGNASPLAWLHIFMRNQK